MSDVCACSCFSDPRLQPRDGPACGLCRQLARRFHLHQPERRPPSPAGVWKQRQEVGHTKRTPSRRWRSCTRAASPNTGNAVYFNISNRWKGAKSLSLKECLLNSFPTVMPDEGGSCGYSTCSGEQVLGDCVWEDKALFNLCIIDASQSHETQSF